MEYEYQSMVSLKSFFPYTNRLVFALSTTATMMSMHPVHPQNTIITPIPARYSQKASDLHLFALYILSKPTNCSANPRQFSRGTTSVSGSEKEERMEVTVEMQMEVQAPPEQTLSGMERAEKMLISSYRTTGLADLWRWSIMEQKTNAPMDSASNSKALLCLTSHFLSSNPVPQTPPSFLTTLPIQTRKQSSRVYETTYFALRIPLCEVMRWYASAAKTRMDGESAQRKLKTSSYLMQAQMRRRVERCMPIVQGEISSSMAIGDQIIMFEKGLDVLPKSNYQGR